MEQLTPQTLVSSASKTASGNSGALTLDGNFDRAVIELAVTAVTGSSPTLDLYIQETLDGTNYVDVCAFTQVTAALTNPHRVVLNSIDVADALKEGVGDATTAAGNLGMPLVTNKVRVKWVLGGTSPDFTLAVTSYADQG